MAQPANKRPDPVLWRFIAGFTAAALLALGAAVGASFWQQKSALKESAADAPMVRK